MNATELSLPTGSAEATIALAAALALECRPGDCILLHGDLGTGKTTFARGFIRALGAREEEIVSPTFTLVQAYPVRGGATVWHFDLYRLKHAQELEEIGLAEALAEGIVLIEWPDRAEGMLPDSALDVALVMGHTEDQRILTFKGSPSLWGDRLKGIKDAL